MQQRMRLVRVFKTFSEMSFSQSVQFISSQQFGLRKKIVINVLTNQQTTITKRTLPIVLVLHLSLKFQNVPIHFVHIKSLEDLPIDEAILVVSNMLTTLLFIVVSVLSKSLINHGSNNYLHHTKKNFRYRVSILSKPPL